MLVSHLAIYGVYVASELVLVCTLFGAIVFASRLVQLLDAALSILRTVFCFAYLFCDKVRVVLFMKDCAVFIAVNGFEMCGMNYRVSAVFVKCTCGRLC